MTDEEKSRKGRAEAASKRWAGRVALVYATAAAVWIVISDILSAFVVGNGSGLMSIEIVKGLAFVIVTATLLYFVLGAFRPTAGGAAGEAPAARGAGRPWIPVAIGAVGLSFLATVGLLVYVDQLERLRDLRRADLMAIADLNVQQITAWRRERHADTEVIRGDLIFGDRARAWMAGPRQADTHFFNLVGRLEGLVSNYGYTMATLYDRNLEPLVKFPNLKAPDISHATAGLRQAMETGRVVRSDIHDQGHAPELDYYVPVRALTAHGPEVVGVIYLHVAPETFLYPLLASWPTQSDSAETLLVRREGDEVLFLNPLRHADDPPLTRRHPLADPVLPAARALRGELGVSEGADYRGVQVLAVARAVPGTEWVMISKVDKTEVFAPLNRIALGTVVAVSVVVILAVVAFVFWWRSDKAEQAAAYYKLEAERRVLATRYDYLSRYANDIILTGRDDGIVIEANDAAVRAYGYSRDELIGMNVVELRAPEERAKLPEAVGEIARNGGAVYRTWHKRKDGTPFPVEVGAARMEIDGIVYIQAIIRDDTDRHAAEERMRGLSRMYRLLSRSNHIIIHSGSLDRMYRDLCEVAVDVGDYRLAAVVLVQEDGQARIVAHRTGGDPAPTLSDDMLDVDFASDGGGLTGRAIADRRPYVSNDYLSELAAEHWRDWIEELGIKAVAAFPLIRDGEILGAFTVTAGQTDVFDDDGVALLQEMADDIAYAIVTYRVEERMRRTKALLQGILDHAPALISVRAADGRVIIANRAFEGLGLPGPKDMVGRDFYALIPPEMADEVRALDALALESDGPTYGEATYTWPDGTQHTYLTTRFALYLDGETRKATCCIATDVTDQREAEQQLWQDQKVQSLGSLAGGIAHDFNNMLLPIQALSEMTLKEMEDGSRGAERLKRVVEAAGRARSLVEKILAFSRKEQPSKQRVNLASVIREVRNLLDETIPSTVAIELDTPDVGEVLADPAQLHAVLMNLCVNAADAMGGRNGHIRISLAARELSATAAAAMPTLKVGRRYAVLTVKDDGEGMDDKIKAHIFDPYFTTKGVGEGTGLGLPTVLSIVTKHDGAVRVESVPGKGTKFEIFLPLTGADDD